MPFVTSQRAFRHRLSKKTEQAKIITMKNVTVSILKKKSIGDVEAVTIYLFFSDLQCQGDIKSFKPFSESQTFCSSARHLK